MSSSAHTIHFSYAEYLTFEASSNVKAELTSVRASLDVRELYAAAAEPSSA